MDAWHVPRVKSVAPAGRATPGSTGASATRALGGGSGRQDAQLRAASPSGVAPRPPPVMATVTAAHPPDLHGGAAQHLPVAVPGAAGRAAAAGGVLAADLAQPLLPPLAHLAVLVLHLLRHELELLDAINFHESEVELAREGAPESLCAWGRGGRRGAAPASELLPSACLALRRPC